MKIHQFFSISLAASIIISCSNQAPKEEVKSASLEQNTYSLNVPVLLSGDTNTVYLSD
jgi:PBP1b-binding outer membrane lipoprotein LpoB